MDVTSHNRPSAPEAPQILAPKDPAQAQALEAERVSRQDRLPGFDLQAVATAHVLVIGAGGLGCPVVQALAAAGVGSIALVDHDVIELSNLQRQPLFGFADCGRAKAEVAAHRAREIAPALRVTVYRRYLEASWILDLLADENPAVIVDCTDTFATKYLIADAAEITGIPLVWGSVLRYQGSVSVFRSGSAHLRDLFPTTPETLESCAEAGVLGATTAVIGSLMATETLKFLAGLPTLEGRLLTYEALSGTFQNFALSPDPERASVTDLNAYELPKILLDVREQSERETQVKYPNSLHLPLCAATEDAVRAMLKPFAGECVGVFCKSGARAAKFIKDWDAVAADYGVRLTGV